MSTGLVQTQVIAALSEALGRTSRTGSLEASAIPHLTLELPKREEWGDFSSNVAMTLAPKVRRPPLEVAGVIATELKAGASDLFDRIDVAPPGFLNLTIKPDRWIDVLREIESLGESFGTSQRGQGQRILIEFVSANPTGPLHVGHGRGAALGHAVSNLLEAVGHQVEREYYVNDAGRQLRLLGSSVFARYQEVHGRSVSFPEDGYHGSYIRSVAERLSQELGEALLDHPPQEAERQCAEFACNKLLDEIKQDLQAFGISFDTWSSEAKLHASGQISQALDHLKEREFVFHNEGALWFKSSHFQDEKDRVVAKQNGDYTYLASDIAYHRDKLRRGFDSLINIWGADHHGYIPRMQAAVQAFGYAKEQLRVVLVQMVSLLRGGQKIEMSKRAGEFVTLREVIDEVGPDAAKYFFLMRRSDTHLDFDLDLAKQQSADNPVYYVQYAHARIASLFRVAKSRGIAIPSVDEVDHTLVMNLDELRLMKQLSCYPGVVESSALALEPHRLTSYLQELARQLHTYYYKHRILPPLEESLAHDSDIPASTSPFQKTGEEKIANDQKNEHLTPEVTAARLALMRQIQTVVRSGLRLLGISAPDQM